jgi:hypothetical protein
MNGLEDAGLGLHSKGSCHLTKVIRAQIIAVILVILVEELAN